jgi:hypothetical protein
VFLRSIGAGGNFAAACQAGTNQQPKSGREKAANTGVSQKFQVKPVV